MIIQRIQIENFRSYHGSQEVDLSSSLNRDQNVIAIGGLNGAGKTSLKDAITFGLLGYQKAFKFVKDMNRKGDDRKTIDREMDSILNREALSQGVREASVTLFVLDNEDARFSIKRTWQFDARGVFRKEVLLVASEKEDLSRDVSSEDELQERFDDFLKNHVPPEVARFFLFDGEEIQRLAEDEPGDALRDGIGTLLGFHLCDILSSDLDELQNQYRSETRKRTRQEEELGELKVKEQKLANQSQELQEEKLELENSKDSLREESRKLVEELKSLVGGEGGDPKAIQQELEQVTRRIQQSNDAIQRAIEERIIPALPGELIQSLSSQLDAEDARAQWEEGRFKVQPQREKLLERVLGISAPKPDPIFTEGQVSFLNQRIRMEWDQLFHPPPPGIADTVRHGYLSPEERNTVRARCNETLNSGSVDLNRMLNEVDTLERRARDLRLALGRFGDGEQAAKLLAEKGRVDRQFGEVQERWEAKDRLLASVQTDLKDIRKQVSKKEDELVASGEWAGRLDLARRIRLAIEKFKETLRPLKRDEVARHLSEMYRNLARKEDVVDSIELDEKTYGPRLLDRRGQQIPLHSQSAGEREIYALSLLWALAQTSRRELPIVIDTPLARLDKTHRSNIVKRYLPQAGRQVIVLSTDTELDRQYFEMIESRIAKSYRLEFVPATERTTVHEGYFDFQ